MNWKSQSGMTLVEVVISMGVTAIVLVGLVGIVFEANQVSQMWNQRTYLARAQPLLADQLRMDARHFVPCPGSSSSATLHLCLGNGVAAVSYGTSGGCPCDLLRTDASDGSQSVVARGLQQPPTFASSCATTAGVDTGTITVGALRYPGDAAVEPPIVIAFRAPAWSCG
jgi:hypothetical protein